MMSLKLSLGAIQYYWPKQTVFAWYDRIADTDADIIYLGETVCARRHELRLADWLAIADNLAAAGKEVLLASQTLLESESDLKRLRKIAKQARYPIEANDMGAVKLARDHGHPFVAGSSLNLYNEHTLALVRRLGAYRWQPPAELSRDKLATLLAASADPGETELFAWGKIPLAYSSRCFTARHYNLNKDNCQFRCLEHPHGMSMDTREKTPFLTINGIQTM
ncbi:MAG: U32 family peptidase, partial [Cardiobacterium sp.]